MGVTSGEREKGPTGHVDRWRRQAWRLAACLVLLVLTTSCDYGWPGIKTKPTMQAGARPVRLMDFDLPLHFAKEERSSAGRPMVLFATGDGGWRGIDREIVDTIARLGYPIAGFSSKDYLAHLKHMPEMPTPAEVGADYSSLIDNARQAMGIPATTSVVLSGFSRGAALAVIAAGDSRLGPSLVGVLAMGLDDVEEHVQAQRSRAAPAPTKPEVVRPYEYLKGLDALPLSVIQSTRDRFLGASQARRLFGEDSELHKLHAITAESHTFGGARTLLFREIEQSLSWIAPASWPSPFALRKY